MGSRMIVFLLLIYSADSVVIEPSTDTIIAVNSPQNVSYLCISSSDDVSLLWELDGIQVWSETQVNMYAREGVFIDIINQTSIVMIIAPEGRDTLSKDQQPISLVCLSYNANEHIFGTFERSQEIKVIPFNAPSEVTGLELIYYSETELRLQWSRPDDVHNDIPINYTSIITNTVDNTTQMYKTVETYVSVNQNIERSCQPHIFTVTAMNDAGTSISSTIMESIPISPNVQVISDSQMIDYVILIGDDVNISISFNASVPCNAQYPVEQYTLDIEDSNTTIKFTANDSESKVSITLSSLEISEISRGNKYTMTIGACNSITCRKSNTSLIIFTTDIVSVYIEFYMTDVLVNCEIAEGSKVKGCILVFTRFSDNVKENITAMISGDPCYYLSQTRRAFLEDVEVYAILSDDSIIHQPVTVTIYDVMNAHNFNCTTDNGPSSRSITDSTKSSGLSTGGKAGIGVTVAVCVVLVVILILAIIGYYVNMRHRPSVKYEQKKTSKGSVRSDGGGEDEIDGENHAIPNVGQRRYMRIGRVTISGGKLKHVIFDENNIFQDTDIFIEYHQDSTL